MKVNHKLELLDQFDDAAFALMMDEYAEAEGERLRMEFEEATRAGLTPAKPDSLDEKCRKQIRREFGKQRRREYAARGKSLALRAAACILVALCISATLIMSVEALRVPFWRFLTEEYGVRTDFDFTKMDQNNSDAEIDFGKFENPVELLAPEGYHCVRNEVENGRIDTRFENNDGQFIEVTMHYDNTEPPNMIEDESSKYINVLGKKAEYSLCFITDEGWLVQLMDWYDTEIETHFSVGTNGMDEGDFILFCERIVDCYYGASIDKPAEMPDALEGKLPETYERISFLNMMGLPHVIYNNGEINICLNVNEMVGDLQTYVPDPAVIERTVAGYDATFMQGGDEIGTIWYDMERKLYFYLNTINMPEEDHLALCEYLAEYYKNVTLPAVSTVIWD